MVWKASALCLRWGEIPAAADVGGVGLRSLTKTPCVNMFWLGLICCRPAFGNTQILAGSLSWWWGEGWGGGAKYLPVSRTTVVVLGQVLRWGPALPAGAFLQTRGHLDVRGALTRFLCGSVLCSSQPFPGHELGSKCRKQRR